MIQTILPHMRGTWGHKCTTLTMRSSLRGEHSFSKGNCAKGRGWVFLWDYSKEVTLMVYMYMFKCSLVPRLLCIDCEKTAWYTQFVDDQLPQDFLEFFKICVKLLRYTSLCKACWLLLYRYERCLPLTTFCVDGGEGATNILSSSLAGIVHAFVHSS